MAAAKRIDKSLFATQAKFAKFGIAAARWFAAPAARFSGTPTQATMILGIFAALQLFGIAAMCYGLWQIATGGRSKWLIYFLVGIVIALVLAAFFIRGRE